jgi:sortase A
MVRILFLCIFLLLAGCAQGDVSGSEQNGKEQKETEVSTSADNTRSKQNSKKNQTATLGISDQPIIRDNQVALVPNTISIPSIGVDTRITNVGILENGQMGVPENVDEVAWFEPGTKPGARGNAVMAGHVDSKTGPAIFFHLKKLKKGDEVIVAGQDGEKLTFKVVDKKAFPKDNAPVEKIFGYTSRKMLNLITCTGDFNQKQGTHVERLVVYTELVE